MSEIVDYSGIDYRKYWEGEHMRLFHRQEKRIVEAFLPPARDGWFLDLGCGFGRFVPMYRNQNRQMVLVDYAPNNLEIIQAEHPDAPFVYIAADACRLPFRPGVFYGGLCIRLIQNIFDPERMLDELSRVLLPGGQVVFSYFNRRSLLRILRFGLRTFKRIHVLEHVASYGKMCGTHPALFQSLTRRAGLIIRQRRGAGFLYQISRPLKPLKRLVETSSFASKALSVGGHATDSLLGPLNLSLWQFSILEKKGQNGAAETTRTGMETRLLDILQCPACGATPLIESPSECRCGACEKTFPKRNGIYDFRLENENPD
jgi:ubiquinone/menaquinone biosynthesis C-methylase UbiE